jgi:hypothetical protein
MMPSDYVDEGTRFAREWSEMADQAEVDRVIRGLEPISAVSRLRDASAEDRQRVLEETISKLVALARDIPADEVTEDLLDEWGDRFPTAEGCWNIGHVVGFVLGLEQLVETAEEFEFDARSEEE